VGTRAGMDAAVRRKIPSLYRKSNRRTKTNKNEQNEQKTKTLQHCVEKKLKWGCVRCYSAQKLLVFRAILKT
jgi:hypothetical protein